MLTYVAKQGRDVGGGECESFTLVYDSEGGCELTVWRYIYGSVELFKARTGHWTIFSASQPVLDINLYEENRTGKAE